VLKSVREDRSFPPLGLVPSDFSPRLAPWAAFLRRFAAKAWSFAPPRRQNFIIGLTQPLERWVADILLLGSTLQGSAKAR